MGGNGHTNDDLLCLFIGEAETEEEAFHNFESGVACGRKATWEVWFHDNVVTLVCEKHLAEILDHEQPQILQYIGDRDEV